MNSKYAQVLIAVVFGVTFSIDVVTPLGYEVYVGHFFAVLLSLWLERPKAPYIVAAIATVLLVLEFQLSPAGIPLDMALFNRIVGIALLWVTAVLVRRARIAKLDDATRRLGAIVETSSDAILSLTPEGLVSSWNAGAEHLFGYTADEMMGRSIQVLIPSNLHHEKAWVQASLQGAQDVHAYDAIWLTKDGRCIDVSITLSPLRDAAGQFVGWSKIIRDISERKRAQVLLQQAREASEAKVEERTFELSNANYSLRELSSRLMQVQEEERSQLARDLHDEVGQLLTALKIDLQEIQHNRETPVRSDSLRDSLELVDRLLTQVRTLALDLRPSILDDLGLVPALRWYANRQATRNGWTLSLSFDGMAERLPVSVELSCFRVTQEALTNVSKYAKAKSITLTLRRRDQDVLFIIQDDGIGFDVMMARQRAQSGHSIGLLGMEERVRLAGGTLSVSSAAGQGTRLELSFPFTEYEQTEQPGTVEVTTP